MENISIDLITLLVTALAVSLIAFFLGKKTGGAWEKETRFAEEKKFQRELLISESRKKELQREINDLKQNNEKYLYFLVRLPETVKYLNSNLSFDEIISAILRLTKDLTDTDAIELYIFNKKTQCLDLIAAYGSNKKKSIEINLGDGVIGESASARAMVSKEQIERRLPGHNDENIELGVPILFKTNLIGVLGVGKIKAYTGNEKRFLAMVADLAAVALQNCEYLTSAKEEAITDALTGLYNKKHFFERALEDAQKALSYNFPLSVFMFDIDHFKKYNDQNGHVEGDVLLKGLSKLLKENTRSTDTIARYGGEEFIVLLPNTEKNNAVLYAEKIRKAIESCPFPHREKQPLGYVSISGGVATFPLDGKSIDSIVKNADKALYESKTSGRNRVTKYESFQFSSEEEPQKPP
ncbi:MAG: GGDEF domain-containing protein [Thermodesulfovibrionales bacterium]|nr:GGDEF domain-containing protein [Thermodesulfovibrionales bacterium]